MLRTCTIRGHGKRRAIEKALLEQSAAPEPLFEEASFEVAR